MNIIQLMTPKGEVEYININSSLRQGLEKMKYHGYSAIPVIDSEGHYCGTVTEGDFLWALYNNAEPDIHVLETTELKTVIHKDYHPVHVSDTIDDILSRAFNQNFVPVLDDRDMFIGIIKRKEIIKYLASIKTVIREV